MESKSSNHTRYCYQRMPAGAACAKQFGVALVQEVERVHDLEPLFYSDFDRFCIESEAAAKSNSNAEIAAETAKSKKDIYPHRPDQRGTAALIAPEFVFRLLRMLKIRNVVTYPVPNVSPLIELDEAIIDQCRVDVQEEQIKRTTVADTDDEEEGDAGSSGFFGDSKSQHLALVKETSASSSIRASTRDQAKQFELLQKRLVKRWEDKVETNWKNMQPLYVTETSVEERTDGGSLKSCESNLAFFSHIDVLTYCILDLFKCAAARGPGGNNGEWSPYLNSGGSGQSEGEASKKAGGGTDAAGRPLLETLTWSRLVMFLADCSPLSIQSGSAAEAVRVFLPPVASRLQPPAGSSMAIDLDASNNNGKKITALDKFHSQPQGDSYDVGRVKMTRLWQEKGLCLLLTEPPKDGSTGESIHFINVHTMRCTRIQQLNNRFGNVMTFELITSPHNTLACAYFDGVRLYDLETFAVKTFVVESETVTAMRFIPSTDQLVIGNKAGALRIYSSLSAVDKQFSLTRTQLEQQQRQVPTQESVPSSKGPGRKGTSKNAHSSPTLTSITEMPSVTDLISIETVVHHHAETVCEILPHVINDNMIVTSSLGNELGFYNVDSKVSRKTVGEVVVLGATAIHSLGLLFCFGVDVWPFVWSYNVHGSKPLSLAGGGSPCLSSAAAKNDKRSHSARIVAVFSLPAPKHAAVSLDKNGGVRIWDLWKMCLLQTIDISSEYVGADVSYFKNPSGRISAFSNYAFDAQKMRLYSFIRQRAFTIRYNRKDDLRTTMLASFEPVTHMCLLEKNRLLLSVTKTSAAVWNLVTARQVFTINIPTIFASYLLHSHAGKRMPIVSEDADENDCSDEDSDSGGSPTDGKMVSHSPARKSIHPQYAGLAIVSVQAIEDTRLALFGLSCGGILVCSLGNGSIICHVPPVPHFYGGNGIFNPEDTMSAAQEIAAAAKFAGDFRMLYYHQEQDTLFMLGAGHTFYEHRGRRHELLVDGSRSVDANVIMFHHYTGLLIICEESGTISAWTQQDQAIHVDSWVRIAQSDAAGTEPFTGLLEIPNSPYLIGYNARGFLTLLRLDYNLEFLQSTSDPTGYYLWPGAVKEPKGGNDSSAHSEPRRIRKLVAMSPKKLPFPDVERARTKEMSCSLLRRYRRQHVALQRKKSIVSYWAGGSEPQNKTKDTTTRRWGTISSKLDGVKAFEVAVPSSDAVEIDPHINDFWPMNSDGEVKDQGFTPETSCREKTSRVDKALSRKNIARCKLLKKTKNLMPQMLIPNKEQPEEESSPAQSISVSVTSPSNRKSIAKSMLGVSVTSMTTLASNSVVRFTRCKQWAHIRINPNLQPLPPNLDLISCTVTSAAYCPEYGLLYVGDELGYVTIYDLTFAVLSSQESKRWLDAIRNAKVLGDMQSSDGGDPTPLPTFSPISKTTSHTIEELLTARAITCVRKVRAHTSPVTAIHITDGSFGCVYTSGQDGTLQQWSLFLQTHFGNLTLGEETSTSTVRYPCLTVGSRLAAAVIGAMEFFTRSQADHSARSGRQKQPPAVGPPVMAPRRGQYIIEGLRSEPYPLLMLPSQLIFRMMEYTAATRVGSEGEWDTFNSADPGGPCQISAADATAEASYSSMCLKKDPVLVGRGANPATRETLRYMNETEFLQLSTLHETVTRAEKALTGTVSESKSPFAASISFSNEVEEISAGDERPPKPDVAKEIYLTSHGWNTLYQKLQHKLGVYDDIPQPYNSYGSLDVPQQPPFHVLSYQQKSKIGSLAENSTFGILSEQSVVFSNDGGLEDIPAGGRKDFHSPTNIEAVVLYKDWCLGQQQRLGAFATDKVSTAANREPHNSNNKDTGSPIRMAEAMQIFRNLHSKSVGDIELGHVGSTTSIEALHDRSRTMPSLTSTGQLPPIFGTRRIQRASRHGQAIHGKEAQQNGGEEVLTTDEAISRATAMANSVPKSNQSTNFEVEARQASHIAGYPPLISPALIPNQVSQLAKVKTAGADDERSELDDNSDSSEEIHDVDEWQLILENELNEKKQRAQTNESISLLQKQYRKELLENKSRAAQFSSIKDEAVLDKLVHVFSKGSSHTTLAYILTKEQDDRATRAKPSKLGHNPPQTELSHNVVKAFCDTFRKDRELSDLLVNAPTLGAGITRTGDTSALRPDITQNIQSRRQGKKFSPALPSLVSTPIPLGRPVSPYVLRKCTQQEFKDILDSRLLESVAEAPTPKQNLSLPPRSQSVPLPPVRLKGGMPVTTPALSKTQKLRKEKH